MINEIKFKIEQDKIMIENKKEQVARLRGGLERVTVNFKTISVQGGKKVDIADIIHKIEELESDIAFLEESVSTDQNCYKKLYELLKDFNKRDTLIYQDYINGEKVDNIAFNYDLSVQHVYRIIKKIEETQINCLNR